MELRIYKLKLCVFILVLLHLLGQGEVFGCLCGSLPQSGHSSIRYVLINQFSCNIQCDCTYAISTCTGSQHLYVQSSPLLYNVIFTAANMVKHM